MRYSHFGDHTYLLPHMPKQNVRLKFNLHTPRGTYILCLCQSLISMNVKSVDELNLGDEKNTCMC